MSNEPKGLLAGRGTLIALAISAIMLLGVGGPVSAQFFNFGGYQQPAPQRGGDWFGGGWFGNDTFAPFPRRSSPRWDRRRASTPVREDFSKAPPPEKRDTVPKRNVLVLGDAMADWLAYGLEDAYSEQPDIGVIRKVKTMSGLIQLQKDATADLTTVAKGILATEKPDVVVVMLGLNDRIPLREPVAEKSDKDKSDKDKKPEKSARKQDGKALDSKSAKDGDAVAKPDDKTVADSELPQDDAEAPGPEKAARSPNGIYQFRDDRWVELYQKKIDEMIAVVKSKGVPVVWVGLPAISGLKNTSDMLFLDALYRDAAGRAGIIYVDIWDGFVDEAGRFMQKGPDFEGQIRQLRSDDGVYFTKPGARKLAHYVEREITRVLAARSGPIAFPAEPATPGSRTIPGQPAPRPLAGPVVPLVAPAIASDKLLGGRSTPPLRGDELAARVMMKGEPLSPPAGRADDFTWPRREVVQDKSETPVASASPNRLRDVRAQATASPSQKPRKHNR